MDKWIKENKITTAIVVVLVVVFGLGYFVKDSVKIENHQQKVVVTSDIDLQTKCSAQAKIFFDYYTGANKNQSNEYSNHYNSKLNKCFVLIKHHALDGFDFDTKDLFDAIEKSQYGSFGSGSIGNHCDLYSDGNKNNVKLCETEESFDVFVSGYMES